MTGLVRFSDNDSAYERWLRAHPDGYVVNTTRPPSASYLKVHSARCGTINHLQKGQTTWTSGEYMKVCAEGLSELGVWARRETGGELDRCGLCRP